MCCIINPWCARTARVTVDTLYMHILSHVYTNGLQCIVLYHESVNDMSGVREPSPRVLSGGGGGGGGRPGYVPPPQEDMFPQGFIWGGGGGRPEYVPPPKLKIKSQDKTLHHLSGQDEVGEDEDRSSVAHEVGDRLHDVPAVVPPGQPRKEPELEGHPAKPRPQHCGNDETSHG